MTDRCICIACLSRDTKTCSILNNNLPELYEKLANIQLSSILVPKTMCYICFSQLKNCYKFMEMSQRAGKILTQLYGDGRVQTKQETEVLDLKSTNCVKTILNPLSLPDDKEEAIKTSDVVMINKFGNEIHGDSTGVISSSSKQELEETVVKINIEEAFLTIKEEPVTIPTTTQVQERIVSFKTEITEEVEAAPQSNLKSKHNMDVPKAKTKTGSKAQRKYEKKDCKKNINKERNHVCIRCGKAFTHDYYLQRHMVTHTGEKRFPCKTCNKSFTQNCHLLQHMRLHTGEKLFVCEVCSKRFSHKYNFQVHMKKHCKSENFSSSPTLRQEKSHKCDICNSAFNNKGELQRHVRVHTGEKPFICDFCNAKFSQKGHLRGHIRTHTDEKPYVCNFCKLAFTQKYYLDDHISVHTGGRLYPCSFPGCHKSFQTKTTIINHMRVHTGERPFACDKCNKTYKQRGHLTTHISAVHAKEEIEKDLLAATKLMI